MAARRCSRNREVKRQKRSWQALGGAAEEAVVEELIVQHLQGLQGLLQTHNVAVAAVAGLRRSDRGLDRSVTLVAPSVLDPIAAAINWQGTCDFRA